MLRTRHVPSRRVVSVDYFPKWFPSDREASLTVRMNLAATRTIKKKTRSKLVPPFRFGRSDVSLDCGWTVLFLSPGRPWKMPAILVPSKPNRPRQISPLFSHTYMHPREVGKEERSQSLIFLTGTDQFLSLSLSLSFLSFKESKTREYSSSRFETTKFRE